MADFDAENVVVDDRAAKLVNSSDAGLNDHLEARRELDNSRLGIAIPGQVHVTDADGVVHNFVGAQTVPLSYARDGGPYLDETDAARAQNRRDFVLAAPNTVKVEDIHPVLQASPSVVDEPTGDTTKLINDGTGRSVAAKNMEDDGLSMEADQVGGSKGTDEDSNVEIDDELLREPTDEELFGRKDENVDDDRSAE